MAKAKKKTTKRANRGTLRKLLFKNRRNIKELEKLGVSRSELRTAVTTVRRDGEFPTEESPGMLAGLIAAELADNPKVELPREFNWDKLIELLERLMPLIQAWISGCGI